MADEIQQLLDERQETHGDAWLIAGQFLAALDYLLVEIKKTGYYFSWIMIFVKLIRAAANPTFTDNWRDIEGYARLVRNDLVSKEMKKE